MTAVKKIVQVVVGIVKKEDQVLMAMRPAGKPYSGYWEFPGGKIEPDESSEAALQRELKEELGIDVIAAHYGFTHHHTYPDKQVILDVWLVNQFAGEPSAEENQTLQWVTWPDITHLRILEGNLAILDKIKTLVEST